MPRSGPKPLIASGMLAASGGTAWLAQLSPHTGYTTGVLVLEMLAWSPAVQKAAGLLSRSCRNLREQEGPPPTGRSLLHNRTRTWSGNLSSPSLKVHHIF